ncbi:MAG TPA: hypothetical protein DCO79_01690 [Spirochaeta sp.]|nr:hypothetical protein [Spirochaeta sp.]
MSSFQQFDQLPEAFQKEVLDFMSFIVAKNGIVLPENDVGGKEHRWSEKVPVYKNPGEPVSETVRKMRDEEKW